MALRQAGRQPLQPSSDGGCLAFFHSGLYSEDSGEILPPSCNALYGCVTTHLMNAICLQHVPFEGPGVFRKHLQAQGVPLQCHLVPKDGLPEHSGDLVIIMGGPMSVNDPDPWIAEEIAFVQSAILAGTSVLGVCLGSQFMAKALGAAIRPGQALEIGMTPIHLTEEGTQDAVFGSMPQQFSVFEWHGEIFDLPQGAVPLASSDSVPVQAFRYGAHAYGLLFHPEVEQSGIESLCRECAADVTQARCAPTDIHVQAEPHLPALHHWAGQLIEHLVASVR